MLGGAYTKKGICKNVNDQSHICVDDLGVISLMPHNLLMQIESPNNILHISILSLNLLLNLGV
jgi:hypothetical protein